MKNFYCILLMMSFVEAKAQGAIEAVPELRLSCQMQVQSLQLSETARKVPDGKISENISSLMELEEKICLPGMNVGGTWVLSDSYLRLIKIICQQEQLLECAKLYQKRFDLDQKGKWPQFANAFRSALKLGKRVRPSSWDEFYSLITCSYAKKRSGQVIPTTESGISYCALVFADLQALSSDDSIRFDVWEYTQRVLAILESAQEYVEVFKQLTEGRGKLGFDEALYQKMKRALLNSLTDSDLKELGDIVRKDKPLMALIQK